ncbi:MAG: phosphatidate cytidylyltransferase, partial [Enterococcus sp.]|nr:phosphatidate cytidylyltransferase [Enterococcus sp.]
GAGFSILFNHFFIQAPILMILLSGILGSLVSQSGDLMASGIKRKLGVKDYGNLIPGHGGVLDRFDSVILVAPFIYYFMLIAEML